MDKDSIRETIKSLLSDKLLERYGSISQDIVNQNKICIENEIWISIRKQIFEEFKLTNYRSEPKTIKDIEVFLKSSYSDALNELIEENLK